MGYQISLNMIARESLCLFEKMSGLQIDHNFKIYGHASVSEDKMSYSVLLGKDQIAINFKMPSSSLHASLDEVSRNYIAPAIGKLPQVVAAIMRNRKIKRMQIRSKLRGPIRLAAYH